MSQSQSCPVLWRRDWGLGQRRITTASDGQRQLGRLFDLKQEDQTGGSKGQWQCCHGHGYQRRPESAAPWQGHSGLSERPGLAASESKGHCCHGHGCQRRPESAAPGQGHSGLSKRGGLTASESKGQVRWERGTRHSSIGQGSALAPALLLCVALLLFTTGTAATMERAPTSQGRTASSKSNTARSIGVAIHSRDVAAGSKGLAVGTSGVPGRKGVASNSAGRGRGAWGRGWGVDWDWDWVVRKYQEWRQWVELRGARGALSPLELYLTGGTLSTGAHKGSSKGGQTNRDRLSGQINSDRLSGQAYSDRLSGQAYGDRPSRQLQSKAVKARKKRVRRVVKVKKIMKLRARSHTAKPKQKQKETAATKTPSKKGLSKKKSPSKKKKKPPPRRRTSPRKRTTSPRKKSPPRPQLRKSPPKKRSPSPKKTSGPSPKKQPSPKTSSSSPNPLPLLRIPKRLQANRPRSSYPYCPLPKAPRPPPSTRSPPPPRPPAAPGTPYLFPDYELYPLCLEDGPMEATLSTKKFSKWSWKGWGTTLARFGNYIGGLPQQQLNEILDLLFSKDKGLGFNIVRYTIWGGRDRENSPQFEPILNVSTSPGTSMLCYNPNMWFTGEGFQPQPGGGYDWSRDAPQRAALLGAKARGADTFTAVSYSPPWHMTVSGDVAGAAAPKATNLRADKFDEFADYLTEVVRQFERRWGIRFSLLEPVNEPNEFVGWGKGGRQEGCSFLPQDMDALYPVLASALDRKNLSTGLVGFDSWAATAADNLESKVSLKTHKLLSQIHVHGYVTLNPRQPHRATEDPYLRIRDQARALGKAVWQTEWTFLQVAGADMDLGTALAKNIIESVNFMGASAYLFWQAIDFSMRFSLLGIRWDPDQLNSYPHVRTKKFWVMKQFTELAPKGSVALPPSTSAQCSHSLTSFYDPSSRTLAFFVVNQRLKDEVVTIRLQGFRPAPPGQAKRMEVDAYRTSTDENYEYLGYLPWEFGTPLTVTAIGRSVTTFVFLNVEPIKLPQAALRRRSSTKKR